MYSRSLTYKTLRLNTEKTEKRENKKNDTNNNNNDRNNNKNTSPHSRDKCLVM